MNRKSYRDGFLDGFRAGKDEGEGDGFVDTMVSLDASARYLDLFEIFKQICDNANIETPPAHSCEECEPTKPEEVKN